MAIYIKNPINKIYTRLKSAVAPLCSFTTMSRPSSTSKFPCFSVTLMGLPTTAMVFECEESAVKVTVQTDTFTTGVGAMMAAYNIDELAHQEFVRMGFKRTYGARPVDNKDNTITRVVSRYERTFGNDDINTI